MGNVARDERGLGLWLWGLLAVLSASTMGCAGQASFWPLAVLSNQSFAASLSSCYTVESDGSATSSDVCWAETGSLDPAPTSFTGSIAAGEHRSLATASGEIGRK
jgi:hypothetical protein